MKSIKKHLDSETTLYADLPGMRANENPASTIRIPEVILVTSARPDIVLVEGEVTLIELTIPHNSLESLSKARDCMSKKKSICSDLEAKGLASHLHTIEIGSLGHWYPTSQSACWKQFHH